MKIELIEERCPVQKEICQPLIQCPTGALTFYEDIDALFGGHILIEDTKCDRCLLCIDLCCGQALVFK